MSRLKKFERQRVSFALGRAFAGNGNSLAQRTPAPAFRRSVSFSMGKEGIGRLSDLLALPCHHIHRVVQKDAAYLSRSFRHKNTCSWKPSHYHGQRADVVLMRVRNHDCFDVPAGDRLEVRQSILACVLRMHPAIEHKPVAADLKVVRVRANLRAACQVKEFQSGLLLLLLLLLLLVLFRKGVRP